MADRSVRRLIVDADDLGYTAGINRGSVETHEHEELGIESIAWAEL